MKVVPVLIKAPSLSAHTIFFLYGFWVSLVSFTEWSYWLRYRLYYWNPIAWIFFFTHNFRSCTTTMHHKHCIYFVAPISRFTVLRLHIPEKSAFMSDWTLLWACRGLMGTNNPCLRYLMLSLRDNFNMHFLNHDAWPLSKSQFLSHKLSMQLNFNDIHCSTQRAAQSLNK